MTKTLKKFRDIAILAACILASLAVAAHLASQVLGAIETGVVAGKRQEVSMADHPTAFWIAVTMRAVGAIAVAYVAAGLGRITYRIYKSGKLFVASERQTFRKPVSRAAVAPLIDEAHTTSIEK